MAQTVVHKASPRAVDSILARFHERGVDAVAVDNPNFLALFFSFGTYKVRIAVPDEELEDARRILDEWDEEARPAVRELSRQVYKQFLLAGIVAGVVAAGLILTENVWVAPVAFVVVWFALVALLGVVDRMRGGGADSEE